MDPETRAEHGISEEDVITAITEKLEKETEANKEFIGAHITDTFPHAVFQTGTRHDVARELIGQQEAITGFGPAFLGCVGDFVEAIGKAVAEHDRLVRRDGPGRGGPDDDVGA